MLRQFADFWWPKIHRDIVLLTKTCKKCQESGKSIKPILKQKQFGKLPTSNKTNEEIAIDFASPFKVANSSKMYLIVSRDCKTGLPDAKLLRTPTTNKVIEFLTNYIANNNSIPRQIRTDPGTAFTSKKFEEIFYKTYNLPHNRPQGKWKFERLIRTITEILRTNKRIVLQKGNTELSEVLYTLRSTPKVNKITPAELQLGRKVTTVKDIITTKPQTIYTVSELDDKLELEMSDFQADQDSEILVRERVRESKLENDYN